MMMIIITTMISDGKCCRTRAALDGVHGVFLVGALGVVEVLGGVVEVLGGGGLHVRNHARHRVLHVHGLRRGAAL